MPVWVTILLAILGSSGVSTIIVALLQRHWSKKDKKDERIDALVEAQKCVMIDLVRQHGRSYISDGEITLSDKENLMSMYKAYKGLGGNGHLETIMAEIGRLEVRG